MFSFSRIGDSMASCNARKREMTENAGSTPLTLGSSFKSMQPPVSLSHNHNGDFSRSSSSDQDASVQSIIEKMQTGLEVICTSLKKNICLYPVKRIEIRLMQNSRLYFVL